jgi:hypothetical protein
LAQFLVHLALGFRQLLSRGRGGCRQDLLGRGTNKVTWRFLVKAAVAIDRVGEHRGKPTDDERIKRSKSFAGT